MDGDRGAAVDAVAAKVAGVGGQQAGSPLVQLKAKLVKKQATRPVALVQPLLPAGASALDVALPSRRDEARFGPVGSAEGDARYADTVREQSAAFASGQRSKGTAREHEEYTLMFEDWLVVAGHGSYFKERAGVAAGEGRVDLQMVDGQTPKVVAPELFVAWLMASFQSSEDAPKGGH